MLKVGTPAPQFMAHAVDGRTISLQRMRGQKLILYFFHKAFTPNCTIETKGFRDNYDELRALGYEVVGISTDSEETQCRFAEKHGVTYPMIGDTDKSLSRLYDVLWPFLPFARRVAYVLDPQHVVVATFRHEFQANKHLDEILRFARQDPATRLDAAITG
jgi:peroxiredoxin Q/BCP